MSKDIWKNFDKFWVGFDQIMADAEKRFDKLANTNFCSYPPFNTVRTDDGYTIELAVAGFTSEDIDIEVKGKALTIRGDKKSQESKKFIFQGLANRAFVKEFLLSETIDQKSVTATIINGILTVDLKSIPSKEETFKVNVKG
jgi:molecular chaperone IbpA